MRHYNILFVISQLYGGGAERVLTTLANGLSSINHTVSVATTIHRENDYPLSDKISKYILEDIRPKHIPAPIGRRLALRRICQSTHADFVIAFLPGAIKIATWATLGLSCKFITCERNNPKTIYHTRKDQIMTKMLYALSDFSIFQTEEAQSWFPKSVQERSAIISNPVSPIFLKKEISVHSTNGPIVTVGRLTSQKNHGLLIQAFSIIHKIHPDIKLHIYGDGELRSTLDKQIRKLNLENIVTLKGRSEDIPSILSQSSMFILSSDYEGVPNALIEAMAIGLPCISTDCPCGGPHNLLSSGEGILVPTGNADKMAEAILEILENRHPGIGARARKKIQEELSLRIILQKWLTVFNNLTNN